MQGAEVITQYVAVKMSLTFELIQVYSSLKIKCISKEGQPKGIATTQIFHCNHLP